MAEIVLDHVTKRFPDGALAVDDVNLTIADGEFVILVGPSGCGKSTTLNMIAGLEDISDGELRIGGEVANQKSPRDRDIGMVFQNYALYPHMTVRENMAFSLKLAKAEQKTVDERVAVMRGGVINQVGPPEELYNRPANLFVAGFIGSPAMNFLPATVKGDTVSSPLGDLRLPDERRRRLASNGDGERQVIIGIR